MIFSIRDVPIHWELCSSEEDNDFQYLNVNRESDDAAVVIMNNFKGQVTPAVSKLLEENNIYVCFLPPNKTDKLQLMV